jgi:hypothetical protein
MLINHLLRFYSEVDLDLVSCRAATVQDALVHRHTLSMRRCVGRLTVRPLHACESHARSHAYYECGSLGKIIQYVELLRPLQAREGVLLIYVK